jgi:Family of unknown function (DUF5677)
VTTSLLDAIPSAPQIDDAMLERCRQKADYREALFLYYSFVGQLSMLTAGLLFESPDWRARSRRTWEVQAGSFIRMSRLMMANLKYFQDGSYGEATLILDRCIMETAIKSRWISEDHTDTRTIQFVEGSSLPDFEFEDKINENIAQRGNALEIEKRMLASIEFHRRVAGLEGRTKASIKKLPNLSIILEKIGEKRIKYIAIGKLGSHAVHGNWPNLLSTSLKWNDDELEQNFEGISSHVNQFMMLPIMVLEAAIVYVSNCFNQSDDLQYFLAVLQSAVDDILTLSSKAIGSDFEPVA